MNMPRHLLPIPIIALLAAPAGATVLVPADLTEIVSSAQVIVHGTVTAVEARWTADRRTIETFVTIETADSFKGEFGREVTFKTPGGQLGPYRSLMIGAPRFREGEEVVVFLTGRGPVVPWVVGLNQGVYRVRSDAAGARWVMPGQRLTRSEAPERVIRGSASGAPVPLAAFREQVRALVRDGRLR
jgi:hypothetical protein